MKSTELRIGNYVSIDLENNLFASITGISSNNVTLFYGLQKEGIGFGEVSEYHEFEPIPLTEEWLLKFGFDSKGSDVVNEYEVNDAVFTIGDDEDCKVKFTRCWYGNVHLKYIQFYYGYTPLTMIEYVHQLQNLYFALTGEELAIKT